MTVPPRRAAHLLVGLAVLAAAAGACGGRGVGDARTWEEDVVIPTYPLRPDDPNPHFAELTGSIIYPYTMQDGFTTELVDRSYRVVFLENDYLRIMCLPEIGGRIHSVYDKIRGEEMFHANGVIKPGHIALRGAWVSGGIEWNRGPQGHTVTSFSPVSVVGVDNDDGSATLVIGYTEMSFRTGWTVRLTLHPDKAYLDERIEIFNPTDGTHPYYFWNNTAFPQRDGTRFIYPMTLGSDHNGAEFFSWPVHDGVDLTWLKNYPGPTSVFGYQVPFDFFGAYDVDRDYGIVAVADHRELPGKKAWTWGQSDAGMAAQAVLTDEDGPYIEVQSGPLPTQADFEMLGPGESVDWQEYWYPVGGLIDGFEYATRDLAVQRREAGAPASWNAAGPVSASGAEIEPPASAVELRLLATGEFPNARVEVSLGGESLVSRSVNLDPRYPLVIPLPIDSGDEVDVSVTNADGGELLGYRSPLAVPRRTPPDVTEGPAPSDAAGLYGAAFARDKEGDREAARRGYLAALEATEVGSGAPARRDALIGLSVLELEAGQLRGARARLENALDEGFDDAMVHYLRGVAGLGMGDHQAAEDAAEAAIARGRPDLGHGLSGRVYMQQGRPLAAVAEFEVAIAAGGVDQIRSSEALMLAAYAGSVHDTAAAIAAEALTVGTVRLVPWAVEALSSGRDNGAELNDTELAAAAADFAAATGWVGEPEFTHLELGMTLADLGLTREAASLTRAALIDDNPEPRPLPLYLVAYLERILGNDAAADDLLDRAGDSAADHVFPSRPEMIEILRDAIRRRPAAARTYAHLGTLYAGLGRYEEARAQWVQAIRIDGRLAGPARNLGLMARRGGDLVAASGWYEQAIAARPDDQTLHRDLAQTLRDRGEPEAAIAVLESVPGDGFRRPDVVVLLADTYASVGRYDDALDLLASQVFTNREGVRATWDIFSRAHIDRGIGSFEADDFDAALADFEAALTYPENLNAGRSHEPQEARAEYWRGRALEALGDADGAHRAWQACAAGIERGAEQIEHVRLCAERLR